MENLAGITLFWTIAMFASFDTWLGRILYGIYVGACLWIFAELTACIIILITNLFYPFISWQNQCQVREDKAKGLPFAYSS